MPEPPPRPATSGGTGFEPIPDAVRAAIGLGLNPLVQAAAPLLLLTGQLRTAAAVDVADLRRHVLEEIRRFEDQAHAAGVRSEIVLAARYALCAGLDEAVLSTPWGAQSEWAQRPVLVALHHEAWGGEKFFEMLDRIAVDPARHLDLMELQYLLLALGFTGKYHLLDRGQEQLADLQRNLHRTIRGQRGPAPTELSLQWRGLEDRRNRLVRYVPWWVVAAAAAGAPRRDVRRLLLLARDPGGAPAGKAGPGRPRRLWRAAAAPGTRGRPDAQAAARARGSRRCPQRRGGRRPNPRDPPRRRPVRFGQRHREP